jgi:2'-hydroxyisoflavone reductase
MVRAILKQGHNVTLFNRGRTNPDLFEKLETINGDRLTNDIQRLSNQKWDLIVDTACYIPRAVSMLMDAVDKSAVKQYIFISTISVYKDLTKKGVDEDSELATMDDPTSEDVGKYYAALKVRCEQTAEQALPGRVTIIRCGQIIGPGDKTDRFTYWPERTAAGGEVLAPGTGEDYLQTIDVRDLAEWVALCAERNFTGVYNSTNPAGLYTFRDVTRLCKELLNSDARFTWVPASFLRQQNVADFTDLPLWPYPDGPYSAIWYANAERATAKGLKHRPLAETIVDIHNWFQALPEDRRQKRLAGISREQERELLSAWHQRQKC